jgi:hypothetical protein
VRAYRVKVCDSQRVQVLGKQKQIRFAISVNPVVACRSEVRYLRGSPKVALTSLFCAIFNDFRLDLLFNYSLIGDFSLSIFIIPIHPVVAQWT